MTTTTDAMTTVRTSDGRVLTLTPTALASGRYPGALVERIPVRSEPKRRAWR
jgi:hypothetical protein